MVSASTDSFWTGRLHNQLYAPAKSNLICTFLDNKQERKKVFVRFVAWGLEGKTFSGFSAVCVLVMQQHVAARVCMCQKIYVFE